MTWFQENLSEVEGYSIFVPSIDALSSSPTTYRLYLLRQSMYEFILVIICNPEISPYHYIFKSLLIIDKKAPSLLLQTALQHSRAGHRVHSVILMQIFQWSSYIPLLLSQLWNSWSYYLCNRRDLLSLYKSLLHSAVRNWINLFINLKVFDDLLRRAFLSDLSYIENPFLNPRTSPDFWVYEHTWREMSSPTCLEYLQSATQSLSFISPAALF